MDDMTGLVLRAIRQSRGWSQPRLAKESGVSTSTIAKIEQGVQSPTLVTFQRLLDAAGYAMWLMEKPEQEVSDESTKTGTDRDGDRGGVDDGDRPVRRTERSEVGHRHAVVVPIDGVGVAFSDGRG
jgi:putative transcriptional regulator